MVFSSLARAHGSLARGFLVAVAGCAPFCCVFVLVWLLRDFRRNGPIFSFTFSPLPSWIVSARALPCSLSRERLRRVRFKNLRWYSSAYHHQLIIILSSSQHLIISSSHHLIISSSYHHHLLFSLSLSFFFLSLLPLSLSLALLSLLFSAHRSGVENRARATLCGIQLLSVKN